MANRLRDFTLSEPIFVDTDATHAVICQQLGIEHLASNDADFDRVSFLTRWEPRP